nr:uncharacterized protein LOC111417477 isoform X3 [Onthophagus taurus]
MAQKDSIQFVPPPLQHLLEYPIKDDINIEDGLCKPENENLFLISSIAFLQKHLIKKFENEENLKKSIDRKYSDLLIVESGQKYMRQKTYIKLVNIEKFDEILKNEASLPQNALSNTQLLPLPKKSKSTKLIMSSIFKPKISYSTPSTITTKKSSTFFNIFKRSSSISTSLVPFNSIELDTEKIIVTTENEKTNNQSSCSISIQKTSNTTTTTTTTTSTSTNDQNDLNDNENLNLIPRYYSNHSVKKRILSEAEEEILRIIPKESNLIIKKNISEKLRTSSRKALAITDDEETICTSEVSLVKKDDDDFYEDLETGIKFKCMPANSLQPKKLKEQQSKLSLCIEDEMESDIDYGQDQRKYPFNCTDDIKALVSPEAIDLIINEVWPKIDDKQ